MSSTPHESSAAAPRRRWRLHWLSWIVLIFASAAATLITVPGFPGKSTEYERFQRGDGSWSDLRYIEVDTWSHGWPWEYLPRPFAGNDYLISINYYPVQWSSNDAWRLDGRAYAFSFWTLAADVVICSAIVAVGVAAFETWRRRRGRFRFSLLDAIVLVAVVCGALGWWQIHARAHSVEQTIKADMKGRGSLTDFSKRGPYRAGARETYCGPDWLQRLLGNPYFLPFCMHITYLDLDSTLLSPDDYADLREFQYVDTVHVVGRLNAALADSLSSLKRLTMLDGEVRTYGGYPGATRPKSLVSVAELPQLKRLPRLKTLRLGFCELAPADVPFLAELPCIERLQICNSDLLIEDLEPLTKCRTLATLDADISATREEQQTFSARHPNLEVHWPKMEPYVPGAMQPGEQITPADVAAVLFEHWRIADGVLEPVQVFDPFPSTLSYEQMMRTREETWQIRGLDFSQLRLSRQRLQRIPIKAFPDVTGITFGVVDSADTVLELIRRCGQLSELDARHVALTKHDLDKLHLLPEASVSLQQGTLTADDICEFAQKVKPSMLNIFASSFGREEVERVLNVKNVTVFVYKGLEEDDRDRLDLILDDDLPNNPFR